MAVLVSAARNGMGGDVLVPPDGVVKLKDKTIPVIEQVGFRWWSCFRLAKWCVLLFVITYLTCALLDVFVWTVEARA